MEAGVPEVGVQVVVPLHLRYPLDAYLGLFGPGEAAFLLESTARDIRPARYSFLAGRPVLRLSARAAPGPQGPHRLWLHAHTGLRSFHGDALETLRLWSRRLRPLPSSIPPRIPFLGGAIGYFGYELLAGREGIPTHPASADSPPDLCFAFVDEVLALDHETNRAYLAVTGRAESEARAEWRAELRVFELMAQLRQLEGGAGPDDPPSFEGPEVVLISTEDEFSYRAKVAAAMEHIRAGDAFEVCLTRRIESEPTELPAYALYRQLREESPAPFSAYLRFPELELVAASPERFLHVDPTGHVESRPIKGTRPRGSSPERDLELRNELATSDKDRAENLMIVDLVRNDLGRVAQVGSVKVTDLLRVEAYRTVHQLVSTVEAQLRPGLDVFDVLEATFPGGSMTGAPKIEAMHIIHHLEASRRGVYSGAFGYIDHRGGSDLAMVIRSAVKCGDRFEIGVGGAVLCDSEPAAEWRESEDKALALRRAFARAGRRPRGAVGADR